MTSESGRQYSGSSINSNRSRSDMMQRPTITIAALITALWMSSSMEGVMSSSLDSTAKRTSVARARTQRSSGHAHNVRRLIVGDQLALWSQCDVNVQIKGKNINYRCGDDGTWEFLDDRRPRLCRDIEYTEGMIQWDTDEWWNDPEYDICHYWEHLYGQFAPTGKPTLAPTKSHPPTMAPIDPTMSPSSSPTSRPTTPWIPTGQPVTAEPSVKALDIIGITEFSLDLYVLQSSDGRALRQKERQLLPHMNQDRLIMAVSNHLINQYELLPESVHILGVSLLMKSEKQEEITDTTVRYRVVFDGALLFDPDAERLPTKQAVDFLTTSAFKGGQAFEFLKKLQAMDDDLVLRNTVSLSLTQANDEVTIIPASNDDNNNNGSQDGGDSKVSLQGIFGILIAAFCLVAASIFLVHQRRNKLVYDTSKNKKNRGVPATIFGGGTPDTVSGKQFFEEFNDECPDSSREDLANGTNNDDVSSIMSHSLYSIQESVVESDSDDSETRLQVDSELYGTEDGTIPGYGPHEEESISNISALDNVGLSVLQFDDGSLLGESSCTSDGTGARQMSFRDVWKGIPTQQPTRQSSKQRVARPEQAPIATVSSPERRMEDTRDWTEKYGIPATMDTVHDVSYEEGDSMETMEPQTPTRDNTRRGQRESPDHSNNTSALQSPSKSPMPSTSSVRSPSKSPVPSTLSIRSPSKSPVPSISSVRSPSKSPVPSTSSVRSPSKSPVPSISSVRSTSKSPVPTVSPASNRSLSKSPVSLSKRDPSTSTAATPVSVDKGSRNPFDESPIQESPETSLRKLNDFSISYDQENGFVNISEPDVEAVNRSIC